MYADSHTCIPHRSQLTHGIDPALVAQHQRLWPTINTLDWIALEANLNLEFVFILLVLKSLKFAYPKAAEVLYTVQVDGLIYANNMTNLNKTLL